MGYQPPGRQDRDLFSPCLFFDHVLQLLLMFVLEFLRLKRNGQLVDQLAPDLQLLFRQGNVLQLKGSRPATTSSAYRSVFRRSDFAARLQCPEIGPFSHGPGADAGHVHLLQRPGKRGISFCLNVRLQVVDAIEEERVDLRWS